MKNILTSILLSAAITVSAATCQLETIAESNGSAAAASYVVGDVNGDGMINALDASRALEAYSASSTGKPNPLDEIQQLAADVNEDSMVNSVDATYILSYYAYLSVGGEDVPIRNFISPDFSSPVNTSTTTQPPQTTQPQTVTSTYPGSYSYGDVTTSEPDNFNGWVWVYANKIISDDGTISYNFWGEVNQEIADILINYFEIYGDPDTTTTYYVYIG